MKLSETITIKLIIISIFALFIGGVLAAVTGIKDFMLPVITLWLVILIRAVIHIIGRIKL